MITLKDKHSDFTISANHVTTTTDHFVVEIQNSTGKTHTEMFLIKEWEVIHDDDSLKG